MRCDCISSNVSQSHLLTSWTCAGDTSLNLAAVFPQGTVVAFEVGPPIQMLRLNVRSDEREKMFKHNATIIQQQRNKKTTTTRLSYCRLNPQFKIDVHNVAVSNNTGIVYYHSGRTSHHQKYVRYPQNFFFFLL